MKIKIPTKSAASLKKKIFEAVEDETLKTWVIRKSKEGNSYLTHKPEQWYDLALLSFLAKTDSLEINITHWTGKQSSKDIDGYYIGRFTEVLLVHFASYYDTFEVIK